MKTIKKLGIWMDHASAHLMPFTNPMITDIVVSEFTYEEKEKTLQKGESIMHNKEQQLQNSYYKKLGESIIKYEEVLLFGPTNAKVELLNVLKSNMQFDKIKIETMQADNMTENQEHAFVKDYFLNR